MIEVEIGDNITLQRKDNNYFVNANVVAKDDDGVTIETLGSKKYDTLSWDTINELFVIVVNEKKE